MRAPSGRAMRLRIAAIQCRQPQSQCRPLSLSSSSPLLASASAQRRLLHSSSSSSSSSSSNTNSPSIQAAPPSSSSSSSGSPSSGAAAAASPASSSGSSSSGSSPKLPPSSSSLSRRKNTDLALILSGTLGISALLFYNLRPQAIEPAGPAPNISSVTPSSRAFTLPVATSSGTQFRQIDMLPAGAVTQLLSKNERSYAISRPGNPLFRYDTNSVASNETCEDAHSFTILEHQGNDYILTSMFDGHAGYATSRLMSTDLEKYIARELMDVLSGGYRSLSVTGEGWWEWLWNTGKKPSTRTTSAVPSVPSQSGGGQAGNGVEIGLDQRSALIPEALRRAYQLADRDIINAPSNYLRSLTGTAGAKEGSIPQMTEAQRSRGLSLLSPALSGSCGLSALIDCSSPQLYVAIAGDSRAVMGTYDAATNKWTAETLSEDQTGRSVKEVNRVRSEHPKNESETVIMRGRVLGGLEPTRAFGDGKYKFPLGVQEKLIQAFRPNTSRTAPPSLYKTPPYVTALPEVTTFALAANPAAIAGFTPTQKGAPSATLAGPPAQSDTLTNYTPLSTSNNTALPDGVPTTGSSSRDVGRRFVVLATDGLYDCLSSEEVVALVAGHLDGLKGDKSKKELFEQIGSVKNDPTAAGTASPHKPRSAAENSATKRYCFEDSNICTHLIRNALGGAQREQVSALLSIPPPHSRRYRDDITITVLLLGSDPSNASSTASEGSEKLMQGVRRIWTSPEKAKL